VVPKPVLINRQAREASVEGDGAVQRVGASRSRQSKAEASGRAHRGLVVSVKLTGRMSTTGTEVARLG